MTVIGQGRDDPRKWVKAAYVLLDAIENGELGPDGKLPTRSEVAAKLDCHEKSVIHAYRELIDMGIIYWVAGHGHFPTSTR